MEGKGAIRGNKYLNVEKSKIPNHEVPKVLQDLFTWSL